VYALGLTLYELLTLRPAFDADSRPRLVEQVLAASPPRPRAVDRAVPHDLETIVLKATAREPARRYQSAAALAEDLGRFLDDRPVLARRASSAEQAWRWCRRNPVVASLLAVVLTVFAAGAGVSAYYAAQAEAKATEATTNLGKAEVNGEQAKNRQKEAETERDAARRLLNVSLINQAQAALADNRIARAVQLLADATPTRPDQPDLRGWEWHYLDRQVRGRVIAEFAAPFSSTPNPHEMTISPGGRLLTTREESDGQVLDVWDTRTGRKVARLPRAGVLPVMKPERLEPGPDGEPPLVNPARFAFAPDGRYLAAVTTELPERGGAEPRERVRLWEVETAAEIPGPPDPPPDGRMRLGPGAAWITWCGHSDEDDPGEIAATVVRWDRASGAVTRASLPAELGPPTPPGVKEEDVSTSEKSEGHTAADGRTLFLVINRTMRWSKPGNKPGTLVQMAAAGAYLACWDLTTSPPQRRWKTVCLRESSGVAAESPRDVEVVFSPNSTSAAAWDHKQVVVYGLLDGKEQWRAPCTRPGELFGVSDDGKRVGFRQEALITLMEKDGAANPRELVFRYAGGWAALGADGRTVLNTPGDNLVRVLDVARDPDRAVLGDVGRLEVLRPGPQGGGMVMGPGGGGGGESNPCVVVDADGREVVRVWVPRGHGMHARLVADGRRLLTVTEQAAGLLGPLGPLDAPPQNGAQWALYDLTGPGRPVQVGGGRGSAVGEPGSPWLVVTTFAGFKKVRLDGVETSVGQWSTALYDALSGKRSHEVATGLKGEDTTAPVFDPGGTRYAIVTWPPAYGPQKRQPHTLRMREAASGRELWSAELGEIGLPDVGVRFRPDGLRVFVSAREFGQNDRRMAARVWACRAADGAREGTLRLTSDSPGPGLPEVIGVSAKGRLLVRAGAEVHVWDPDTGERTHRLPGHDGLPVWAATTSDDTRLFILDGSRLHLWDLTTGRDLLVLPVSPAARGIGRGNSQGVWFDGQRLLVPTAKGVQAFDGSPMRP
jgi:WD40 repeat protein